MIVTVSPPDEHGFVSASVLDQEDAGLPLWEHFLSIVAFRPVPRLATSRPRGYLDEVKAAVAHAGREARGGKILLTPNGPVTPNVAKG